MERWMGNAASRACRVVLCAALAGAAWEVRAADAQSSSASPLPGSFPLRREVGSEPVPSWKPPIALLAIAGAGGAWALWRRKMRSRSPRQSPERIVRLSSQALTTQASVHAVQWNGEELLLGCTAQQVTLLSRRAATPAEQVQG
jgi:hypothetical protein